MTKSMFALAALGAVLAAAGPAAAHGHAGAVPVHAAPGGFAGADPCLLGTATPGECVGPVRVARDVTVAAAGPGPAAMSGQSWSAASQSAWQTTSYHAAGPVAGHAAAGPSAPPLPGEGVVGQAPPAGAGCTPQMIVQRIPCDGQWVYARPAQAPVPAAPVAAPVVIQPAPVVIAAPAPVPAPLPQAAGPIPLSFFAGGISNGVGFNTETQYVYGGGGFAIVGGGTRFSGVRERSPTPLVPPRRPVPRHAPPPKHCGC